jgi:hypothetical protein
VAQGPTELAGDEVNMIYADTESLLLALGMAQVDAMFRRQEDHAIDDSEFLPLVEVVIDAFEMAGIAKGIAERIWEHTFDRYDRMCKEVEPDSPTAENRQLMQSYLLGKRRRSRK